MSLLKEKTHALVEDLLDAQMKSEILQFLWWIEHNENVYSLQEFIGFLEIAEVQIILVEMNNDLFWQVLDQAKAMKEEAESK